jgi:hypothetical protein
MIKGYYVQVVKLHDEVTLRLFKNGKYIVQHGDFDHLLNEYILKSS